MASPPTDKPNYPEGPDKPEKPLWLPLTEKCPDDNAAANQRAKN
jgi:hypothetical protein